MAITLDGTNGITTPALENDGVTTVAAGSASAPAITTDGDTNTGIFFPAADTIAFAEGGAEAMRIDSSGNVGIGTTSPSTKLTVNNGSITAGASGVVLIGRNSSSFPSPGAGYFSLETNNTDGGNGGLSIKTLASSTLTERARIDSSGNLIVNATSQVGAGLIGARFDQATKYGIALQNTSATATGIFAGFYNSSGTLQGYISQTNSTTTAYITSSDYRLKENIAPMTGALNKIAQLKPVTYKWKQEFGGTNSQGFIAHELQAVVPECVTGEKDAVDADGNPQYQGVDTSFLVATLTAAIQELSAKNDALEARIAALEGAQA